MLPLREKATLLDLVWKLTHRKKSHAQVAATHGKKEISVPEIGLKENEVVLVLPSLLSPPESLPSSVEEKL